jgi:hypothetical protein
LAWSRKAFACSAIHAALGLNEHGDKYTRRLATWMKARMKHCLTAPPAVTTCLEKKSHCHRLCAWALKKSAHVPFRGSVLGSNRLISHARVRVWASSSSRPLVGPP